MGRKDVSCGRPESEFVDWVFSMSDSIKVVISIATLCVVILAWIAKPAKAHEARWFRFGPKDPFFLFLSARSPGLRTTARALITALILAFNLVLWWRM